MHKAITIDRDVRVISAKRRLMISKLKLDEVTTNANALCIQNENLNRLCHVFLTACAMIRKDLYVRRQEAEKKTVFSCME